MSYVLAIDPGTTKSAWVVIDEVLKPVAWAWEENIVVRDVLRAYPHEYPNMALAIEYMRPRGMPTSQDEMDTMVEIGRMVEVWGKPYRKISRHEVKMHLCGQVRAKDDNIRAAVIDRYGGQEVAIGGVKCFTCKGKGWVGRGRPTCTGLCEGTGWQNPPGLLYEFSRAGMGSHGWSALALALTAVGTHVEVSTE